MISANEARAVTNDVHFKKYEPLINSAIFAAAKHGKNTADILIPEEIAGHAAEFLEKHGYRVVTKFAITGILITAAW